MCTQLSVHNSAYGRNKTRIHTTIWMSPRDVVLSDISLAQKHSQEVPRTVAVTDRKRNRGYRCGAGAQRRICFMDVEGQSGIKEKSWKWMMAMVAQECECTECYCTVHSKRCENGTFYVIHFITKNKKFKIILLCCLHKYYTEATMRK